MIARFGGLIVALALGSALAGDGARLTTVSGATMWLAQTVGPLVVGLALVELGLVVAGTFSARARARVDHQLRSLLTAAAAGLPATYLREWEGELHAILQGPPIARVWPALRYVVGLRRAAPTIARVIGTGKRVRPFGKGLGMIVLIPVVTPVFLVLVALIAVCMVVVAGWAAVVVVVGARPRPAFGPTFVSGCRRAGLCLFGRPAPDDTPGEKTLLSL